MKELVLCCALREWIGPFQGMPRFIDHPLEAHNVFIA